MSHGNSKAHRSAGSTGQNTVRPFGLVTWFAALKGGGRNMEGKGGGGREKVCIMRSPVEWVGGWVSS